METVLGRVAKLENLKIKSFFFLKCNLLTSCKKFHSHNCNLEKTSKMKEKVSKLKNSELQHCLSMLHIMHTTITKGGIGQSGSKP